MQGLDLVIIVELIPDIDQAHFMKGPALVVITKLTPHIDKSALYEGSSACGYC